MSSFLLQAISAVDLGTGLRGVVWELIFYAGPVVKTVLFILVVLSIVSWAIILLKYRVFRSAIKESETFLKTFWETQELSLIYKKAKGLPNSPLAELFRAGFRELEKALKEKQSQNPSRLNTKVENINRVLRQARVSEMNRLQKYLIFLATTGNTAPFIGLFGTVWGIMDAFRKIGLRGSTSLAIVAPGISEALIATAAGLFAAIPAVVAYNYFLNKTRMLSYEMGNFSLELLNTFERLL